MVDQWKEGVVWLYYSQRHILWLLTSFYGQLEVRKRKEASELIAFLKPLDHHAWCVIGDFNEITSQDEKQGSTPRIETQMIHVREALEVSNVHDLGWREDKFI